MKKDHYKVLGLNKNCDIKEVVAAYKKLSKKYHPDLNMNNPESTKKFAEISEAYQTIIKEKKGNTYEHSYERDYYNHSERSSSDEWRGVAFLFFWAILCLLQSYPPSLLRILMVIFAMVMAVLILFTEQIVRPFTKLLFINKLMRGCSFGSAVIWVKQLAYLGLFFIVFLSEGIKNPSSTTSRTKSSSGNFFARSSSTRLGGRSSSTKALR